MSLHCPNLHSKVGRNLLTNTKPPRPFSKMLKPIDETRSIPRERWKICSLSGSGETRVSRLWQGSAAVKSPRLLGRLSPRGTSLGIPGDLPILAPGRSRGVQVPHGHLAGGWNVGGVTPYRVFEVITGRVTIQVDSNFWLTSRQKFHFSIRHVS